MLEMRMNILNRRDSFPECVAKGSCFLSWGSGGGGLFARRFVFFSNRVVPLPMGKVRKGDVLWRVKVHFAWQAWDFVALKRKLLRGSLMFTSLRCLWGKWVKVMWLWEVWSVECEVCSGECGVGSVKCAVGRVECGDWSVECEVWSVECGVWSVKCGVHGARCEMECEVWSVKCEVWSVKCEVECEVWSMKSEVCGVWS